jgi:hypothetical protein
MVIDGNKLKKNELTAVDLREGRIHFPQHLVEVAGFTGRDHIRRKLLVVTAGRYRLTKQTDDEDLSRVSAEVETVGAPGTLLDYTDDNRKAAIRARLIDCTIAPQAEGWRVYIPEEVKLLLREKEDKTFIFVFTVAGFVEFWFPNTLSEAVSVPISELLR